MRRLRTEMPDASIATHAATSKELFSTIRFRRVLLVTWIAYAGYQLGRRPFSVSRAEIERETGISKLASGNVDTAFLVMYTIGQLLYGSIVKNRWSNRAVLTCGLLGSAVACLALASGYSALPFAIAWGANGMFQAFGWAACMCIITPWLRPTERGIVMGLWGTNMAAGGIAGNTLTSFFMGHFQSWRLAIALDAAILLSIVVMLFLFLGEHPNTFGLLSPMQLRDSFDELAAEPTKTRTLDGEIVVPADEKDDASSRVHNDAARLSLMQTLRLSGVASISFSYFFHKLVRYSLIFWLPYYFTKELHYAATTAGYVAASLDVGGVLGCVGSGYISDRFSNGNRRALCSVLFALGLVISLLCFAFLKTFLQANAFLCCAVVCSAGFFTFSVDSLITGSIIQDYADRMQIPQHIGAINGVVGGIGTAGSIFQAYLTVGVSNQSWDTLFMLFSVLTVVAVALMAQLVRLELRSGRHVLV